MKREPRRAQAAAGVQDQAADYGRQGADARRGPRRVGGPGRARVERRRLLGLKAEPAPSRRDASPELVQEHAPALCAAARKDQASVPARRLRGACLRVFDRAVSALNSLERVEHHRHRLLEQATRRLTQPVPAPDRLRDSSSSRNARPPSTNPPSPDRVSSRASREVARASSSSSPRASRDRAPPPSTSSRASRDRRSSKDFSDERRPSRASKQIGEDGDPLRHPLPVTTPLAEPTPPTLPVVDPSEDWVAARRARVDAACFQNIETARLNLKKYDFVDALLAPRWPPPA